MDEETLTLVRASLREAMGSDDLGRALVELGWDEVEAADPVAARGLLFEEHGRALATSRILDSVVVGEVLEERRPDACIYPTPWLGLDTVGRVDGGKLVLDGYLLGGWEQAERVLAGVVIDGETCLVAIDGDAVRSRPGPTGWDGTLGWSRAESAAAWTILSVPGERWASALDAARRALAHEIIGLCHLMLERASVHVAERQQFGRPIGTFQAVRHRLADVYVATTAAAFAVRAADEDRDPVTSAAAKVLAGQAHRIAVKHCVQVSGAIGLTEEHPLPAMVLRGGALDAFLGAPEDLTKRIGRALASAGTVPLVPQVVGVRTSGWVQSTA